MALIQLREVPDATVRALKARAAERGLTLCLLLGGRLDQARLDEAIEDFGVLRAERHGE